jgi:hypothetical protein
MTKQNAVNGKINAGKSVTQVAVSSSADENKSDRKNGVNGIYIGGVWYPVWHVFEELEVLVFRFTNERPCKNQTVQNGFFEVEPNKPIKFNVFGKDSLKNKVGTRLLLKSTVGNDGKLRGVQLVEDNYNGQRLAIKVNGGAIIEYLAEPEPVSRNIQSDEPEMETRREVDESKDEPESSSPTIQRIKELGFVYKEALRTASLITKEAGFQEEMATKDVATVLFLKLRDEGLI